MKRRSEGLCGPRAPAPWANGPWTPLGDIAGWGKQCTSASFAGVTESLWASGPRKPGKNALGKARFPQGIFPRLSPDALHPGWRLRRRARSHNVTKPGIPSINSGRLSSRRTKQHPPTRVQGDHPPGQVWAESPAYPLCLPSYRYFLPFIQMLLRF